MSTVNMAETRAADPAQPGPGGRRHRVGDIFHERTNFQFIHRSWRWAALSGGAVLLSVLWLLVGGLNLGIDFDGGTQWSFTVEGRRADAADVRDALAGVGQDDARVLVLGDTGVRVQTEALSRSARAEVAEALSDYAGIDVSDVTEKVVGPTWGDRVTNKALEALVIFFAVIAVYLSVRFEWRMALAAIVAVVHDIVVTAGVYAITGFEVSPATVVAFLTILGFSLYDTVVVFDKVRDNERTLGSAGGDTYSMMVNRSLNQVLMRSLNTTVVAVLPVVSLLVVGRFGLGAVGLQDFALALFVGLLTGTYSSVFVATPIAAALKERDPRFRAVRGRVLTQRARAESGAARPAVAAEPVRAAAELSGDPQPPDSPQPEATPPAPPRPPAPGTVTPRPRQQRRKRR